MKKIQPHLIVSLNFSSISEISTIPASKRVVNIPNCTSVNSVLDFLTSNAANLPTNLLVFIFNIKEPKNLTFDRQKLQNLSEILKSQESERIFVFQSKFRPTKFLCKIKNQVLLTKIELTRNLHEDEFTNFLITNEMIFKAVVLSRVEDGICGVYDYSFSDIILDINRHFFGIKLVDYALINFDSLSLKFLQLFGIDLSLNNENGDRPLETAAKCGNFCGFLELLESKFDFLTLLHQPTSYNLLMLAAENGSLEILQFLLELDVLDVNYCVKGQTALTLAINEKKVEAMAILLEHDARYDEEMFNDFTKDVKKLHKMVENGGVGYENQEQIKKTLQKYPKTRNFFDSNGQSVMITAVKVAIDEVSEGECSTRSAEVEKNLQNFIEFLLINGLRMGTSDEFPEILTSKMTENPLFCDYIHKILSNCVIKGYNECSIQQIDSHPAPIEKSNESIEMTFCNQDEDNAKMSAEKEVNNDLRSASNLYTFRTGLEIMDLISLESEVNSNKDDKDSDVNSTDGSDFELVDNSDTESLVCKLNQANIQASASNTPETSTAMDAYLLNTKENGHKMMIDALKLLNDIPEAKILLEIFGLYEDVTTSVDLRSLRLEIKENYIKYSKLDNKSSDNVQKSVNYSISSSIYSSSSEVSSLRQAMESFDIISSASSTSCEVIDDDARSMGSVASDRTLNSFSSFENLSNVENLSVCSDFEEILDDIEEPRVLLVQNSESFSENLLPKIDKLAQNLIEQIFNFVVFKVFDNNLKPFYRNDEKSEINLNILAQEIHEKFLLDQIEENSIKNVFKNQNCLVWGQNLLACVPKMCIFYAKKEEKLQENRQNLNDLFEFYENLIIEFKNRLNSLKISTKIANLNKLSNILDKIVKASENFKWINLDKFKNLNIFGQNFNKTAQNSSKFIQILLTNSSILTLVQILKEFSKNPLIFVDFETFLSEKFQIVVKNLLNQAYLVVSMDSSHKKVKKLQNFEVMSKFPERILFIVETSEVESITEENIREKIEKVFENNENFEVILQRDADLKIALNDPRSVIISENSEGTSSNFEVMSPESEVMCQKSEVMLFNFEVTSPKTDTAPQKPNQNPKIQILTSKLHHEISDFTENTKNFLLQKEVDFQGCLIKFSDLISSEILQEIDERSFQILIDNKEVLKIGQKPTKSDKFYFDRKFVDSYYIYIAPHIRNVSYVDSTKFFLELLNQKIILLCDEPGMGKTTTLKQLQFKFKDVFPSSWVVYVDLKRHASIYEDFKDIQHWNYENFTKFFTKIHNLSEFEGTIFHGLLLAEKVVFLIDGVDEITQKHKDFMINFTKDLFRITNCHIWIGMRPHCINEYRGAFSIFAYHLEPIDSQKFLDMYVKSQNMPENVETNIRAYVQKFKNFNKSCSNPLFISIALDIYDQLGTDLGFYMIYEKYVWKKFGVDDETEGARPKKSGNSVGDSNLDESQPKKSENSVENSQVQLGESGSQPETSNKIEERPQNSGIILNPHRFYESKPLKSGYTSRISSYFGAGSSPGGSPKKWISVDFPNSVQEPPTKVAKLSEDLKLSDDSDADSDSDSSEKDRMLWPHKYGDAVPNTQATVVEYTEEMAEIQQQQLEKRTEKMEISNPDPQSLGECPEKSGIQDLNHQKTEKWPQKSGTLDQCPSKSGKSSEKLENFEQNVENSKESPQKSGILDLNCQSFEEWPQNLGTFDEMLSKTDAIDSKEEVALMSRSTDATVLSNSDKSTQNPTIDPKDLEKSLKNISKIHNLIKLHQRLAMKKFILFVANLGFRLNLPEANVSFIDSEIVKLSSYDIVYGTTDDQVFFIHQTFYEFFIASFIVGKIFEGPETNQDPVISTIFSIIFTHREFEVIAKFINFYVKDNENEILARNNKHFKYIMKYIPLLGTLGVGDICYNLDRNVHRFMTLKHFDLARLALKMFQNEAQMEEIFRKISSGGILQFLDVCSYGYSSKETLEFLSIFRDSFVPERQKIIFKYFLFGNFTIFKEILLKLSENGVKKFFGIYEEIFTEDELTEAFRGQINADQDPNFSKLLGSIHKLSNDELTSKTLEIFLEFSTKFLNLDQKCLIVQNFAENLEIAMSKNPKIFKTFENFMSNLEKPEIREILMHKNSKVSKIFLNFASKKIKFSHFQFLLRHISENLEEIEIFNTIENHSNLKIEFLHACSQNMTENIEIFTNFIDKYLPIQKLKEFLLQKDPNCQFSTVHFLFQNYKLNFERIFSKSEIKNLILFKNFKNETILFEIFRKKQKLSENFFNLMLEFLDKTELKSFLCHKSNDRITAFQVFGDFLKNYEIISFSPRNFAQFMSENFEDPEVMEMVKA